MVGIILMVDCDRSDAESSVIDTEEWWFGILINDGIMIKLELIKSSSVAALNIHKSPGIKKAPSLEWFKDIVGKSGQQKTSCLLYYFIEVLGFSDSLGFSPLLRNSNGMTWVSNSVPHKSLEQICSELDWLKNTFCFIMEVAALDLA